MSKCILLSIVFAVGILSGPPAVAWDRTGHLVVARIAWERMSSEARSAAADLLAAAPEDSGLRQLLPDNQGPRADRLAEHFQNAAYWPDIVRDGDFPARRGRYHHGDWHWINIFFETRGPANTPHERTDLEPQGRIVERLGALIPTLGDASVQASDRAIHLAWVLHLAGDIHQPLHATARVTATEPQGDRGGNLFELGRKSNLHAFWDGILRSSNVRWFFQSEDSYVQGIARSIQSRHPPSEYGNRIQSREFDAWARESFEIASSSLYPVDLVRHRKPPSGYEARALELAERRIVLAGYRLAELLGERLAPGVASRPAIDPD